MVSLHKKNITMYLSMVEMLLKYHKKYRKCWIMESNLNNLTLAGQVMPALLPLCYAFFEVGCILGDTPSRSNNIAVSSNGYLQCIYGQDSCRFHGVRWHKCIMVEVKSPFPQEHLPEEPYYDVPVRHVPQLLCEMFYFSADELFLICVMTQKRNCDNCILWSIPVW